MYNKGLYALYMPTNTTTTPYLKPGLYRFTTDVKNPKADRRTRDSFFLAETWKAGSLVVITERKVRDFENDTIRGTELVIREARGYWTGIDLDGEQGRAMLPHLEPLPIDSVDRALDLYAERSMGERHVLHRLHEVHGVPLALIAECFRAAKEGAEADDAAVY